VLFHIRLVYKLINTANMAHAGGIVEGMRHFVHGFTLSRTLAHQILLIGERLTVTVTCSRVSGRCVIFIAVLSVISCEY